MAVAHAALLVNLLGGVSPTERVTPISCHHII